MERFLSAVAIVNQAAAEAGVGVAGESLLGTIKIAVLPIAKVFTMCFLGFLMASKYVNILPASGRKLLNGLVFSLLLPCLIFSQLGQAITIEKMLEWWFIPMNVILGSMSGSLIGFIVASLVPPPYPFFKFSIIQIGIGNIGNVPLVLIAALCRDKSNPFGDSEKCSTDGTAYISFGQWVGAIILYTYVFHMLAPPPGGTFDIEDGNLPIKDPPKEATAEQLPLLTHEEAASVNSTASANPKEEHQPTASEKGRVRTNRYSSTIVSVRKCVATATIIALEKCFPYYLKLLLSCVFGDKFKGFFFFLYEKLKLKQILQPPIIASILAMLLGAVPFFKQLIFTADAPFFFFTDSCIILGEAMIPCILLALGGNLVDGPGSSKLGLRTTAAIIFARLVLVPPAGLGIVMLADKLGFLPAGDKMFRFVLLLQHTMPTSVLAGAVANLRGCGREAAAVLFWVHIFAVISMSGWIVLYLNILF